ncbi:hypothetical protein FXO37_21500 [Capsicum annuum]|nr:hypothetical protein FXO37_21500 [Capsicum annuum]
MALGLQNAETKMERDVFRDLRVITIGLNETIRVLGRVGNFVAAAIDIDIAAVAVSSLMSDRRRYIWDRRCWVVLHWVCWWFAKVDVFWERKKSERDNRGEALVCVWCMYV